jgi:hypothetical protein
MNRKIPTITQNDLEGAWGVALKFAKRLKADRIASRVPVLAAHLLGERLILLGETLMLRG